VAGNLLEPVHRKIDPSNPAKLQLQEVAVPDKIDQSEEYKHLYQPSAKAPVIVTVPPFNFITLEGRGDPNSSQLYQDTLQSLYQMAYTLKFGIKKAEGVDFQVMPLEGLWWAEDMLNFLTGDKGCWLWRMMIAQPPLVTAEWVERARGQALAKKDAAPRLRDVQFQTYAEGLCVQILHLGPYSAEGPNVQRIHTFAHEQGYQLAGLHHEIYLGDPRRTAPEKLKTVLRQPITVNDKLIPSI
jgi:hypothetical protein